MTHRQILEALTGLLAALFTAMLSSTIVANALPTIMSDLKGTQTAYAWVITAALLANAASTPIWGKLADLFNKKLLVQIGIVIFVIGSVIAGLPRTSRCCSTARVIQGVAWVASLPWPGHHRRHDLAPRPRPVLRLHGCRHGRVTAGGPLLGGVIVDSPLGWRWCFFVCVPLAVIALILLQATLNIQHTSAPPRSTGSAPSC